MTGLVRLSENVGVPVSQSKGLFSGLNRDEKSVILEYPMGQPSRSNPLFSLLKSGTVRISLLIIKGHNEGVVEVVRLIEGRSTLRVQENLRRTHVVS